jgi:hypothetical protein
MVSIPGTASKVFDSLADLRWEFITCEIAYLLRDEQWLFGITVGGPTEGVYVPLEKALKKVG